MTQSELLAVAKPILFNTEMVRKILAGKKTQTRRVCKITINRNETVPHSRCSRGLYPRMNRFGICANFEDYHNCFCGAAKPTYQPGDILYVRETWAKIKNGSGHDPDEYAYLADNTWLVPYWHPSIHMPKDAARIFLRVIDVRVERLRFITHEDACAEGAPICLCECNKPQCCDRCKRRLGERHTFAKIWDGTIKRENRDTFGWNANPWVWVYTFERVTPDEEETS